MSFPDTPPVGDNAGPAGLLTCASSPRSGLPRQGPVAVGSRLGTYSCGGSSDWRDGARFGFPVSPLREPARHGSRSGCEGGVATGKSQNKCDLCGRGLLWELGLPAMRTPRCISDTEVMLSQASQLPQLACVGRADSVRTQVSQTRPIPVGAVEPQRGCEGGGTGGRDVAWFIYDPATRSAHCRIPARRSATAHGQSHFS